MAETNSTDILVQQQSIPADIAVAAKQATTEEKKEPDRKFAPSNLSRLKKEAPDVYNSAVVKAIQSQMFYSMKKSGDRIVKAMRKARKELERRR